MVEFVRRFAKGFVGLAICFLRSTLSLAKCLEFVNAGSWLREPREFRSTNSGARMEVTAFGGVVQSNQGLGASGPFVFGCAISLMIFRS